LNRFRKKPVNASAFQKSSPVASATGISAAQASDPRMGPARPTRASASALPPSDRVPIACAEERDEQHPRGAHALPAQLDVVAHLVDEQERHEAHAEAPAPDQRVGADRDEHGERRGQELRLAQEQQADLAELQQRDPHDEQGAERAAQQ
jgi:hypothetical protein